jgi:hypothetical protein
LVELLPFFLLALLVGTIGGMMGIGGAVILIPVLIFGFGWPEKLAQGTALAMMLPPVGLLAVWQYHKAGNVKILAAVVGAACFLPAAEIGAKLADILPAPDLARGFGVFAILLAVKLILQKPAAPAAQAQPPPEST